MLLLRTKKLIINGFGLNNNKLKNYIMKTTIKHYLNENFEQVKTITTRKLFGITIFREIKYYEYDKLDKK